MTNSISPQFSHNRRPQHLRSRSVQQTQRVVRQDKSGSSSERIATPQPASPQKRMRAQQTFTSFPRSQKRSSSKRNTVPLTLWVKRAVKAEVQRIAQAEGVSISSVGGAFLEKALQQNLQNQQNALIQPIIEQSIRKGMSAYSNRLALLLVRVAFESSQTRSIVTNILSRQPAVTQSILTQILDSSSNVAKRNITRKTPQLESILTEIEQWLTEKEAKTHS